VAEESRGPSAQRVEAEERRLHHDEAGEREPAHEGRREHALAVRLARERLLGEVEEGEEQELARVLHRDERVGGERGGEQRPDAERDEGSVERCAHHARPAEEEAGDEDDEAEDEEDLAREDGDEEGGGDGREQGELEALEGRPTPRSWLLPEA
jgi:hypothetical protein